MKSYIELAYTIYPACNDMKSEWFLPRTAIVVLDEEHEHIGEYKEPAYAKLKGIISERYSIPIGDVHVVGFQHLGHNPVEIFE